MVDLFAPNASIDSRHLLLSFFAMAAARVSHKRSYDDFITPYGSFGYSAHAGRNVESVAAEKMDVMDDFVPTNKRSKYAFHDDESANVSAPSTQATLAAKAVQSMPTLSATNERTVLAKNCESELCPFLPLLRILSMTASHSGYTICNAPNLADRIGATCIERWNRASDLLAPLPYLFTPSLALLLLAAV